MNRQQRRAIERRKAAALCIRMGDLSLAEAEVLAEALDAYALKIEEDAVGDLTGEQVWARGRAIAMRDLLQASIEGRPAYDSHGKREAG